MWKWIAAPLVGLVIGYITNDLAIRMLFHPYRPIYIGKWRVPFTPGLIPSQRERLARSLGQVVGSQLLGADTLCREALSEELLARLRAGVENGLRGLLSDGRTAREALSGFVPETAIASGAERLRDGAAEYAMRRIREAKLGELAADHVIRSVRERFHQPLMRNVFGDVLSGSVAPMISGAVDQLIDEKGPGLIRDQLAQLERDVLDQPLSTLLAPFETRIPAVADGVLNAYRSAVEDRLGRLIEAMHIDRIVERRIAAFEPAQLEQLIFGIMRRELRAIVYLGAALGFLMGFINLLF